MLEHFSDNTLDVSQNITENVVEVLTLSSDNDQSEPETLTSSDWEPHKSEINIKEQSKIQLIDSLREKSSEDEISDEIDQLDLKIKNISVNNVSHKDFNYTFTENDFSKNLNLESECSETKSDKKINIEDKSYFKNKFPFIFDLENYKKNIQNQAIPIQFVTNKQLKINEFQEYIFHLNKKHNLTFENPSNDLNKSPNTDSLSNSDSNTSSNSKINSVLKSTTKSNLKHDNYSFSTFNSDNKSQDSNFFDFDVKTVLRDPMQIKTIQKEYILQFFRSGDYQKTIIDFEDRKRKTGVLHQNCNFWLHFFGFDSCDFSRFPICWAHLLLEGLFKDGLYSIKQRLNSQISTISKKLDSLNTYIKFINLPLNPFNKPKDLTAIECLELSMVLGLYYFKLKLNLDTKDHDINMKQITDIRKKRIKNISMKYYIEKEEEKKKAVNKKKREEQKFKRFRRIEIKFNSHLFKVGNFVYTFDNEYLFIREIIQNSSKGTFLLVQKIKAEINKRFFYFENPRKFYLIQPDDFRNIINFIPDTWSDSLFKENDQERENTSNSTKKMEIEKEHDISENQSNNNQATQDL
ncbi:hypothetical protein M0812_14773 [Anaeramoeba flamelloides]|uniref:Uncharacterized protein n=1 Tax=Anaeramoeba flamelloides TaxID=1746091 RepID=A0AAV7ZFI5_9EUKA|nr:hypothetical protein M0812_14773 [Anaeramoeba flamelloides]